MGKRTVRWWELKREVVDCPECLGTGDYVDDGLNEHGFDVRWRRCWKCDGTGKVEQPKKEGTS